MCKDILYRWAAQEILLISSTFRPFIPIFTTQTKHFNENGNNFPHKKLNISKDILYIWRQMYVVTMKNWMLSSGLTTNRYEMKKLLTILFLFTFSIIANAQVLKERRVYYLDCSFSMLTNGIWKDVRDNLKKAIDNVSDETTELIVIPFADNTSTNPQLTPMREYATTAGKEKLKSQIDLLPMKKQTMTYHYIPLNDFYNKRVDNNRVTYMFLMTDGQDEDKKQRALNELLPKWGEKFGNKNVYGFYVMLHDSAANPKIDQVVNKQEHLWKVQTANVNINLVRLESSATFNAKNDKSVDLRIYGDVSGKSFSASFSGNCPYKVKKTEIKSDKLRIWIDKIPGQKLPESSNYSLNVKMAGGGKFDFLVTEKINVKCLNKPERTLKISVR